MTDHMDKILKEIISEVQFTGTAVVKYSIDPATGLLTSRVLEPSEYLKPDSDKESET